MTQNLAFDAIKETFALMDDWEDRYAYLIDLGRKLPPYPENLRDDAHLVPGCTSNVWMAHEWNGSHLKVFLDSDAHLVKGLLAVLAAAHDGQDAKSICTSDITGDFKALGLEGHLSPNRRNGFFAVAGRFDALAQAHLNAQS